MGTSGGQPQQFYLKGVGEDAHKEVSTGSGA